MRTLITSRWNMTSYYQGDQILPSVEVYQDLGFSERKRSENERFCHWLPQSRAEKSAGQLQPPGTDNRGASRNVTHSKLD